MGIKNQTEEILLEACVDNFEQALLCVKNGADRIELCSNLKVGGLFPGRTLLKRVLTQIDTPITVMIRPRPGNFEFSIHELNQMYDQIKICHDLGVYGVVIGASKNDQIDINTISKLMQHTNQMSVTIHKVVDMISDPIHNINELLNVPGIDRVLSSGGKRTAWDGRFELKEMINLASTKFQIMPGGSVTYNSLNNLHEFLGAKEYHGRKIVELPAP